MENKVPSKDIFESGFDSFEIDDGFLLKIDSDLKKNEVEKKQFIICNTKKEDEKEKKNLEPKTHDCELPLFFEDLNESDFYDSKNKKNNPLQKVIIIQKHENSKTALNGFISALSPVQGPNLSNRMNLSSSTPVKPNNNSNTEEKPKACQKKCENSVKFSDFDYLEADLFDDWGESEINKNNAPKDTITLSGAFKLIEEAKALRETDAANQSIDLLTGEVVTDVGNLFEESFGLPKSDKENQSTANKTVIEEVKLKPSAAQKLNFDCDKGTLHLAVGTEKKICFSSDDDFDFLTEGLLENLRKPTSVTCKPNSTRTGLNDSVLNESSEAVRGLRKRKGKRFQIIESDSTENSPSPKFRRESKLKRQKNYEAKIGREFLESEAEVSDVVEISSDEAEDEVEGEYDKSFLDEESYFTQNYSADMTAKYLESVKTVHPGNFKIPTAKPYNANIVFSQMPETNPDYEIDSFCVNEIDDDEVVSDLSDLEVAEKILEMDRKKRKKKRKKREKSK